MIKIILELISKGKVDEAKKILSNNEILLEDVINAAYEYSSVALYTLVVSMLIEKETAKRHEAAALLMSAPLCFYKDAYSIGLFHARKLLLLEPNNYENKALLLLFHDIPERLVKKEEAIQLAKDILKADPHHIVAQQVLKKYDIELKEITCN